MEILERLLSFKSEHKDNLLNYNDVISKMTRFSLFSPIYFHRKTLPQYVNENNFLFGFDFGVIILKDKLIFLADKLWIHDKFQFLEQIIVVPKEKIIHRNGFKIKNLDKSQIDIFNSLINIFLNKNEVNKSNENKFKNKGFETKTNYNKIIYHPKIDIKNQVLKFIKNKYTKNKSKSYILSEDDLKRKYNRVHLFTKGEIWTKWIGLRTLIYGNYRETLLINGIFGLTSGIYIYSTYVEFIFSNNGEGFGDSLSIELSDLKSDYEKYFNDLTFTLSGLKKQITSAEKEFLLELFEGSYYLYSQHKEMLESEEKKKKNKLNILREVELRKKEELRIIEVEKEKKRIIKLNEAKSTIISQLDKDDNNEVDLIDSEIFNKILLNNQKIIIEIDKVYIQKFVKISLYLNTKKYNMQEIFKSISEIKNENELNELVNLLKNQIHAYESLLFHSISMITSLVEKELITFYEIYECFDELGVFNSTWENEVSFKLQNINSSINEVTESIINLDKNTSKKLQELMYSINYMENKIVNSVQKLSYVTRESFSDLTFFVDKQLTNIDSTMKFNNLLTGIQTYQMYKINQNTKSN